MATISSSQQMSHNKRIWRPRNNNCNYSERRPDDSAWWDISARRNRAGDNITFDFNEESIVITGLPDHRVLGVEALTQTLDNDVENIEWETTLYDDIITINVNSFYTSGERIDVQARAGNDIFLY